MAFRRAGAAREQASDPGVIVLGVDSQIGLSVVRELGEHGVRVYGIGRSKRAVGLYSRYLQEGFVHAGRDDALVALLRDIGSTCQAPFVMTVSEGDILFLNRRREELEPLRPLVPTREAIEFVIDKARVYALAHQLGIRTPVTHQVMADGAVPGSETLAYPVVLKWSHPNEMTGVLREHGLVVRKAEYCHSAAELESALARYEPVGVYPLVQSYCPGYGLGQMIYMHQGEAVLRFQHRRMHEWPPEGGYSTLCESLPADRYPEFMGQSIELLREIGWEGPAMVEYRFDPASGEAVLMEINGRFWGSLPLAYHARARFAWALYNLMGMGRPVEDLQSYKAGVRCKFLLPDAKRLARILFQPQAIPDRTLTFNRPGEVLRFLGYLANPFSRYYVFLWRDPMPLVSEILRAPRGREPRQ